MALSSSVDEAERGIREAVRASRRTLELNGLRLGTLPEWLGNLTALTEVTRGARGSQGGSAGPVENTNC